MSQQDAEGSKLANSLKDQGQVWDRISGLPDEELGHILSFLPTKSAVATSILSTRWRYLFVLNCLYFEDSYENVCTSEAERKDLRAAILREVRELYLNLESVDFREEQMLPYTFCNSESLEVIKITANSDLDVPKRVWLPSLKVLHLKFLKFIDRESVERFFCGCTALEVLTLDKCELGAGDALIYSATLKELTVIQIFITEMIKIDAPNLGYVRFVYFDDILSMDPYESPPSFGCLKHESTVTHLSLHEKSFALVPFYEFPAFPNLTALELSWFPLEEQYWNSLIGLIYSSSMLKTIKFQQIFLYKGLIKHVDGDDQLENCLRKLGVSWSLHLEVEVMEVHCFSGTEGEFI